MLCWLLTKGKCTSNLLMAALAHDMAEQAVSDVAATTKRALGIVDKLQKYEEAILEHFDTDFIISDAEKRVLGIADKMEGMLNCCREVFRGNRYVVLSYHKWRSWMMDYDLNDTEMMVLNGIEHIWAGAIRGDDPLFDIFAEVQNGRS